VHCSQRHATAFCRQIAEAEGTQCVKGSAAQTPAADFEAREARFLDQQHPAVLNRELPC
jgi:hypothetical protein